jgi:hypothetical protein
MHGSIVVPDHGQQPRGTAHMRRLRRSFLIVLPALAAIAVAWGFIIAARGW